MNISSEMMLNGTYNGLRETVNLDGWASLPRLDLCC